MTEREPVQLPRILGYPAAPRAASSAHAAGTSADEARDDDGDDGSRTKKRRVDEGVRWGIGSHSDYELWTMILSDAGGLDFLNPTRGWAAVPFVPGGIVMNVGDVLDRLTGGTFKSRYHRKAQPQPTRWRAGPLRALLLRPVLGLSPSCVPAETGRRDGSRRASQRALGQNQDPLQVSR